MARSKSKKVIEEIIEDVIEEEQDNIEYYECPHDKLTESDFEMRAIHKISDVLIIDSPTTAFFNCTDCGERVGIFVVGGAANIPHIKVKNR